MKDSLGRPSGSLLYIALAVLISAFTAAVLLLPYDTVYIQEETYLLWFLVVMSVCFAVFLLGMTANALLWMRGKGLAGTPEARLLLLVSRAVRTVFSRRLPGLLRTFLKEAMYTSKLRTLSRSRWLAHLLILGGFAAMLVLDVVVTICLDVFHWSPMIDSDGWAKLLMRDLAFDIAGLMMLVGLCMAIVRRLVLRPRQLATELADVASLSFLLIIVVGGFVLEGMGIDGAIPGHESENAYSFVGLAFSYVTPDSAGQYYDEAWLLHGVLSALFVAYIPFSKLFHMIAAPITITLEGLATREAGRR
ncbi:MAG: respiratory nitrate reductase subunit gamma [Methanobacteriota archaeon]|nr:MAG: respiratory nitrate reductase subunit gamma [Euryarchaeota archaeon]